MYGVHPVSEKIKSVSAVKPKDSRPHSRSRRKGGYNVRWKRITAAFDEGLKALGNDPAMVAPLSRWVIYQHITARQAMAGRRYASIVRRFERYTMTAVARSARSANLQPLRAEDQEIERRINAGTLDQYETDAREAKRHYRKITKVLDKFADPLTGRNFAKDALDNLCLSELEPPSALRPQIGAVLTMIADAFGVQEKR